MMKKENQIQIQLVLAQITVIVIWFLITVIQWTNNPKSNPGITIPLIVRGIEALSVFIVSSSIIFIVYKIGFIFKTYIARLTLLVAIYLFSLLANIISISIRSIIGYAPPKVDGYFFIQSLHFYIPLLLVFVVFAVVKNRIDLQRETENRLKAQSLTQQAKWMMLRYQVNPHFLFNALNSIRALIGHNDDEARKIVTEMSEYFRYSLSIEKKTLVEVKEEIKAVENYLEIQKIRYQDKLSIKKEVASDVFNCLIPVFSIQTLVENAVKYGLKTHEGTVAIIIKAFFSNNQLNILIKNSGKLISPMQENNNENGTNTGIKNLKSRLNYLDKDYKFNLTENDGMVVAHIRLLIDAK